MAPRPSTAIAACALTATLALTTGALPAMADDDDPGVANEATDTVAAAQDLPLEASTSPSVPEAGAEDAPVGGSDGVTAPAHAAASLPGAIPTAPHGARAVTIELKNPGPQTGIVGSSLDIRLEVTTSDGGAVDFEVTDAPKQMQVSAGHLRGVLQPEDVGVWNIRVTARHASGPSSRVQFQLTVESAVAPDVTVDLTNPGDQTHAVGDEVLLRVDARASDSGPVVFSAENLPDGLRIGPITGEITGTLTTPGLAPATVTATRYGTTVRESRTFTWHVTPAPGTVYLADPGDQANLVGDDVELSLEATTAPGEGPVTFEATGLPDRVYLNPSTGKIWGVLTAEGEYDVVVQARLASGRSDQVSFHWTVAARTVSLTSPGDQAHTVGEELLVPVQAEASDGGQVVYSANRLPDGLTIDPFSGEISGTPTAAQVAEVTVTGTRQGTHVSDSQTFTWAITDVEVAPEVEIIFDRADLGHRSHRVGDVVDLTVTATASNDEPLTYLAQGLPDGLNLEAGTGRITGTVTTAGEFQVEITATEPSSSASAVAAFDWSVASDVDVDLPDIDPPDIDLPDIDPPGTDLPGTDLPGTDLPATDLPGTDLPATGAGAVAGAQPAAAALPDVLPTTGASGPLGWIAAGAASVIAAGAALLVAARRRITA